MHIQEDRQNETKKSKAAANESASEQEVKNSSGISLPPPPLRFNPPDSKSIIQAKESEGNEKQIFELEGTPILGHQNDFEGDNEEKIMEGERDAVTRAVSYLNGFASKVNDAVRDFMDYSVEEIENMEGTPTGLWETIPGYIGTIIGITSKLLPNIFSGTLIEGLNLAATLTIKHTKSENLEAKQKAISTMKGMVKGVNVGMASFCNQAQQSVKEKMLTLALTDENARTLLRGSTSEDIDELLTIIGIPDPTSQSPYLPILDALMREFSGYLARENFEKEATSKIRSYGFKEMMEKDDYQERIQNAQNDASDHARKQAEDRKEPGI